ncbi:hypothetical protein [Giesbergeria anulus]|uniref:Uncharacterized protein n=1 Tax=Giesbergeria anulus TaxID=180197 RepID=A0A1H9PWK8_9BURK|nr:hypothetical protein [Giesbergeria anulus]SER52508.1 hypothetical protein SAMN02982919_02545 [Giesbergeria anulus]
MFSLIFAIISIGLVVALAAGTMYYLSVSSDKHAKEAAAAGLLTQGEQIVAAIDMRSVTVEGDLTNLQQLVARNYLSSMPTPATGTYAEGLVAKDSDWWLLAPGMLPAVMLQNKLDAETCLAVNRKLGLEGVKSKPDAGRRIQCFGDAAPYTLLLNPSAKPDVLEPAIESWNRCVADPTSPGCTPTTTPEPFCVANPTDAACTTSTSTPVCVADPTNALCVTPTDPSKSFCELHPADAVCKTTGGGDQQPLCVVEPTNALCLVPPDTTPFCVANPTNAACTISTSTPVCVADPANALCVTPTDPSKSFCELHPADAVCKTTGGGDTQPLCVVEPTNALCLVPPNATPFCELNPVHTACTTQTTTPLCVAEPSNPYCTNPAVTPSGAEPALPFFLPTGAKMLPAPALSGGPDSCVPVVKDANGGYVIKSSCNASWCQNAVDGGSWKIIGTEASGLYGCNPAGVIVPDESGLCTPKDALDLLYANPELRFQPEMRDWLYSSRIYWLQDAGVWIYTDGLSVEVITVDGSYLTQRTEITVNASELFNFYGYPVTYEPLTNLNSFSYYLLKGEQPAKLLNTLPPATCKPRPIQTKNFCSPAMVAGIVWYSQTFDSYANLQASPGIIRLLQDSGIPLGDDPDTFVSQVLASGALAYLILDNLPDNSCIPNW